MHLFTKAEFNESEFLQKIVNNDLYSIQYEKCDLQGNAARNLFEFIYTGKILHVFLLRLT